MSIITREKSTAKYIERLESIPENIRKNKENAVVKFEEFCKKHHNTTPDELCRELLIIKKTEWGRIHRHTLWYFTRMNREL